MTSEIQEQKIYTPNMYIYNIYIYIYGANIIITVLKMVEHRAYYMMISSHNVT